MKRHNILRYIIPASAMIMALSSCLKDDNVQQDLSKLQPIIEIPDASPNSNGSPNDITAAVVGNANPIAYSIPINYAFGEKSPGINVTVKVDEATLTKYNSINEDDQVEMLPAKFFSIPNNTIQIPAGKQSGSFVISLLNTVDEDYLNHNYAIPIKITDASGKTISGNYRSAVVKISIKNIYDGEYLVTGTMVDATSANNTGTYPYHIYLVTQGQFTNAYFDPDLNGGLFGHRFSGGYFGNFAPVFQFNANGDVVAVTNYYGQGTNPQQRAVKIDPTGENKMTTVDGKLTMNVKYIMTQGGADRLFFTEKWVYEGERP